MLTTQQQIAMAAIDFESLTESEENHESVEFDILLTETPDKKWVDEFQIAYRNMSHTIKPPVHVIDDRLRIAYLPRYDRELQGYIEFLKTIIRRANEEVEQTVAISKRGNSPAHIEEFRESLKKVRVGTG